MLNGLREFGWTNVTKCFALFPTVEKMAETPQGKRLRLFLRFFDYFNFFTRLIMFFFELIPYNFKRKIFSQSINGLFNNNNSTNILKEKVVPNCVIDSSLELIRTDVVSNIIHMSNHELNTVRVFRLNFLKNIIFNKRRSSNNNFLKSLKSRIKKICYINLILLGHFKYFNNFKL